MKNSKLVLLLASFSESEFRQLAAHFDRQKDKKPTKAFQLFQLVARQYPDFSEQALQKEGLYKKLFPGAAYSEIKLLKLMSELTGQLEAYIIARGREHQALEDDLTLLRYYHERNLDKYFEATANQLRKELKKLPEGSQKYMLLYRFLELETSYALKSNNRYADYQQVYQALTELNAAEQLRWKNLSMINLFPALRDAEPEGLYFRMHRQLHELLIREDDAAFREVLHTVEKQIDRFDKEESRELLKIVLDHSIRQVNNGVGAYYEYLLRIYKLFVAQGLILNDYGRIAISTYKNYITVALKLGKPKDALNFLETYRDHLPEAQRGDVYTFNKANILFEQGQYEKSADLLQAAHFNDIFYKINRKRLLIKIYYELQGQDASGFTLLDAQVNAFYKFIYIEKKIPDVYLNANKNFIKFIKKLLSPRLDKKARAVLLQKVQGTRQLAEREWLEAVLVRR